METISKASVERAKGVAMLQGRLLDAENYQNLQDEKQLYAEVLYLLLVNFCYVMFNVSQAYCNVGGDVSTWNRVPCATTSPDEFIFDSQTKSLYRKDITRESGILSPLLEFFLHENNFTVFDLIYQS